jgi:hypothetical protein
MFLSRRSGSLNVDLTPLGEFQFVLPAAEAFKKEVDKNIFHLAWFRNLFR